MTDQDDTEYIGIKDLTMETFFTPKFILILSAVGLAGLVVILLLFLLCHRLYKHHIRGYNPTATREVCHHINFCRWLWQLFRSYCWFIP